MTLKVLVQKQLIRFEKKMFFTNLHGISNAKQMMCHGSLQSLIDCYIFTIIKFWKSNENLNSLKR